MSDLPEPDPPELLYSSDCPYCRMAATGVELVDVLGRMTITPLESPRGIVLLEDHHGTYVHAPHLFTNDRVYYGVKPVLSGLTRLVFGLE